MGLLTQHNTRWALSKYEENQIVYSQGDPADSVFYVHTGKVKVTVISQLGKEAVVAIRGPDEFCGEGAMTGTPLRLATTTTMSACEVIRIETKTIIRLLHEDQEFADYFHDVRFSLGCGQDDGRYQFQIFVILDFSQNLAAIH